MYLCANAYEADDLYQETWLKALKHIEKYDKSKEFEPWLTKICVNTYKNTLRRIARSPVISFWDNDKKEAVMRNIPAQEKKDYLELYEAIENLPEKLRMTVIIVYFWDYDIAKTADVLAVPQGTVKSRLNKARKLLKEALKSEADL